MQISACTGFHAIPPAAYALPEVVSNRTERGDIQTQNDRAHPGHDSSPDTYAPTARDRGEAALELPGAVRGGQAEIDQRSCCCGSCSGCGVEDCALRQEVFVEETRDEAKAAPSDQEQEKAAGELSEAEQRQVEELQQRDREVRAHEQAHAAAGARNVRYDYQIGPDGRSYAVGGSCDIEMSHASDDPDAKAAEARRMRAAALAPADPSAQDMAVAAKASRIEAEATAEKAENLREEQAEQNEEQNAELESAQPLNPQHAYGVPDREPTGFAVIA